MSTLTQRTEPQSAAPKTGEGSSRMKQIKDSRHEQFESAMMPYMDMLFSYAYYLTGEREGANDLLQDTYMKAYRFFDKFEIGTNAKAWLYRIMRNTYINEYRRVQRIPDMVEYDEQASSYQMLSRPSSPMNDLRETIDREMFDDDIAGAIAALPEEFKSVVVLRDIEDLPYEEIADALEIPIGTVRSRLHRARAILFTKLRQYAKNRGYAVGESFQSHDYALAS